MAAGRKEYELQMKLSAALSSSFNSSFQAAMSTTKKLQSTLSSLKKAQGDISAYKKTQEALTATKAKVQEYETKHNALQSELSQTVAKEKELQTALKESEKSTGKDTAEYKQLQKQLQNTRNEKSKLKSQIKDNERATSSANEKIKEQEQRLSELSQQLKATGTNTDKLTQENEKLEKAYRRVQQAQEDCARVNSAIEQNKAAISATKNELLKTVGVVGAAGAAFYKGFITPAANLQEQMSTVKAISGATNEEMEQLNALAKKMGATTKFTAVEAGKALEYMAMAGWKTNNMMSGLPGIMNLAAASGEALATVSDIVTDAMTAFGLAADGTTNGISNVNYFTDILAAASANSNTNVALLGESFKYAAPLAGAFGFSVEDTALALGLMANSGIKASQSGTSLRKIFTALTGELKIAQKDGSNFVVATQNADGSMRGLKDIIDDVRVAFNGMSEADIIAMQKDLTATAQSLGIELNDENGELKTQAALYADVQDAMQSMTDAGKIQEAEAIASKTAMAGLLSIVNSGEEDYNKLADAIYNANGAAEKMAQTRLDNLNGDITLAKSAWDGLATTIGEMFLPELRTAITKVTEFLNKANEFAQNNPEVIKQIVKVASGLAALKVGSLAGKLGLLEMKGGVLEVVKSFLGLRANMAESAAAAVTGGGKFTAFGKSIAGYFKNIKSSFGGVGASINKLSGGTLGKFSSFVGNAFKNVFSGTFGKLGGFIGNSFKNVFGGVFGKIGGTLSGLGSKIAAGPLGKIGGVFSSLGKSIGAVVGGPLKSLGGLFGGLFGKAMPIVAIISALSIAFLKLSGEDISGFIAPLKDAFEQLKPVLSDAMNQFKEMGKQMLPLLVNAAKQLAPILGQLVTALLPVVVELIQSIVPLICQLVQDLLPAVLNIITTLAPLLADVISAILPIAVQLLQTLLPVISEIASAILPVVADIIKAILPVLSTLVEAVLPILTTLLQALMPIIQALLPIITQIVSQILPIAVDVLNMLMPLVTMLIESVLPVLTTILQALAPVIQVLADLFGGVLGTAIQAIMPVIQALTGILQGLIDFVTGVFSGDWGKAWEGIKNIFGNIVNGIVAIFKIPINGIIDLINLFIGGLNKLKIPDWVPGVGGMGINIPLIPKLEKGSNSTPDTFIAGDVNGKGGELVTGARGRKVFTAAQTTAIFDNINKAKAINSAEQNAPRPATIIERVGGFIGAVKNAAVERFSGEAAKPDVSAIPTSSGETKFEINYSPTIYVEGDKPGDLEEKLKQNNEKLMQMFKEFLRQERENERRMSFA